MRRSSHGARNDRGAPVRRAPPNAATSRLVIADLDIVAWGSPAAANAAARLLHGEHIVFINGAVPVTHNWEPVLQATLLAAGGGVAGPRIMTRAGDECGFLVSSAPLTMRGFELQGFTGVPMRIELDALASDCLITSRAAFEELDGFVEDLESELACIDYCLRIIETGRRVMFEPAVSFTRGVRSTTPDPAGERRFAHRWRERAVPRENFWPELTNSIVRRTFHSVGILTERVPIPVVRVLVHGATPPPEFSNLVKASRLRAAEVVYTTTPAEAIEAARRLTELRGAQLVAFVRSDTALSSDWLNELLNAIESAPDTVAATVAEPGGGPEMPAFADARCTIVAPRLVPQHLRIEAAESLDAAVANWTAAAVVMGRNVQRVRRTATLIGPPLPSPLPRMLTHAAAEPFVSIVMLSWNAPDFTVAAIESIRQHTGVPHEIIIVDNGSRAETIARLEAIDGIRVIYNAVNTGFAYGCNQGIAAACGTHVVLLNNDVVVTGGWLEALLAVQRTNPAVACSAPRTNRIAGHQQLDVDYVDLADLPAFAARRALEYRGRWTREFRVVGFCLCLDMRAVAEIGGLDPVFGTGNFEDDDYCMRLRAAGYDIAICEDAFIHHFGSVSFRENDVDYNATFKHNKALFASHWNVEYAGDSYDARYPFRRGFVRARDYVPLPAPAGVDATWVRPA